MFEVGGGGVDWCWGEEVKEGEAMGRKTADEVFLLVFLFCALGVFLFVCVYDFMISFYVYFEAPVVGKMPSTEERGRENNGERGKRGESSSSDPFEHVGSLYRLCERAKWGREGRTRWRAEDRDREQGKRNERQERGQRKKKGESAQRQPILFDPSVIST